MGNYWWSGCNHLCMAKFAKDYGVILNSSFALQGSILRNLNPVHLAIAIGAVCKMVVKLSEHFYKYIVAMMLVFRSTASCLKFYKHWDFVRKKGVILCVKWFRRNQWKTYWKLQKLVTTFLKHQRFCFSLICFQMRFKFVFISLCQ